MYFPQINIYDLVEYSTVQYSSLEKLSLFLIFFLSNSHPPVHIVKRRLFRIQHCSH